MTIPPDRWTALRLRTSTRDHLVAFCAKSAKERGFKKMSLGDGIDLLLTIMDHLPEDTRLEE